VFPRLSRVYFARLGVSVEVVPMSGSIEIAPHLGIADVIVDLTSTGSTLRVNGLVEIATVLESTARLIAAPALGRAIADDTAAPGAAGPVALAAPPRSAKARALDELVAALTSVLRARGKRYLMANVPRAALERVRVVLPGLNGPTVVDVMNGDRMVAVHAVVESDAIYRTIARLKALGGEGILVARIERLMP
jgi:ATP phosphoribosyltransferase